MREFCALRQKCRRKGDAMKKRNCLSTRQRLRSCDGSTTQVGEATMPRCCRGPFWFVICLLLLTLLSWTSSQPDPVFAASPASPTAGSLEVVGKDGAIQGACPLKHTEVHGAISGFLARVTVTQNFENSAPTRSRRSTRSHFRRAPRLTTSRFKLGSAPFAA